MKAKELRELEITELESKLAESRQELFNMRFQRVVGQLENKAKMRLTKRNIARILTIINQKQSQASA
jgi:large subunit ribosomal protein L29